MIDGVAQWQRLLLPAAVLAESDGRRTPRDWVVDALMYAFSVGLGVLILSSTLDYRSSFTIAVDVALGVVAFVALWFRRSRPTEVAVLVIAISSFSSLGGFMAGSRPPARAEAHSGRRRYPAARRCNRPGP